MSLLFKLVDEPLVGLKRLKTKEDIEGEENVVIPKNTTDDPWLNKLLGKGNFIGHTDDPTDNLGGRFIHNENDPKDDIVDPKCKSKKNIIDADEGKCTTFKGKKPKDKNHNVDCSTNSNKVDCSSKPNHAECSSKPGTKKNYMTSEAIKKRLTMDRDGNNQMYPLVCAVGATSCTIEQQFLKNMEQIKELDPPAQSEDIMIYIRQRMCDMNKVSFKLEDTINPSVQRKLEDLKEKQRNWLVYPSGYRDVEVKRGDVSYGVNLHTKKCGFKFWELSEIPCVHAMETYYHMKMDPELEVNEYFSKQAWYNAYQDSIRPATRSKLWKPCENPSPLPPTERNTLSRPRKQRIKHPIEDENRVSRVGRVMHCNTCWEVGHNKKGCQNQPRPKPLGMETYSNLRQYQIHLWNNLKQLEVNL
uniref:Zinc finger, PMZ-type n=1 Tax=Tanacetum cinerariifolium TaxID=118510 RepID=A0A6L2NB74_TANCI|nr:zinc finger, PMZ-type [Tanacetum cinerariifolium]